MINFLAELFAELFVENTIARFFFGIFRFCQTVGIRTIGIFTGELKVPVKDLRIKYDDSVWPWLIGVPLVVAAGWGITVALGLF